MKRHSLVSQDWRDRQKFSFTHPQRGATKEIYTSFSEEKIFQLTKASSWPWFTLRTSAELICRCEHPTAILTTGPHAPYSAVLYNHVWVQKGHVLIPHDHVVPFYTEVIRSMNYLVGRNELVGKILCLLAFWGPKHFILVHWGTEVPHWCQTSAWTLLFWLAVLWLRGAAGG